MARTEAVSRPVLGRWMFVATTFAALVGGGARAAVPVDARPKPFGPGDRFIYPLAGKARVDGDLAECKGRQPTVVLTRKQMTRFGSVDGKVDGDADISGTLWIAYTPDGFYLAGQVTDDLLVGGAKGRDWARVGTFGSDTLLVSFLSGQKSSNAAFQESYLAMTYYERGGTPQPQKHPSEYVARKSATGYAVEGFLPFGSVGWRPRAGDWLQFYVILVDQDGLTKAGKRNFGQLLHHGKPESRLRLMGRGAAWGGDIHTDQTRLPAGEGLYLSGTIDALKPGGAVREVSVRDAAETVVFQQALSVPLRQGHTTRLGLDLADVALAPGKYQAAVAFGPDAKTTERASTTFEIVPSGAASTPPPNTLASLRYMRFVLPEDPPPYKPMKVTKADYWKLVRELWPHKHFKLSVEDSTGAKIRSYGVYTSSYMIDFVLLYKLTGNPGYARVAIGCMKALDEATRTSTTAAEQYDSLALAEMYRLMKGSPDFPPAEERRWHELIVREARHTWANEKHQGGMFEYGNNNRGFWYLFRYALALKLKPDVPEAKVWKPYVDRMWPYYLKIKDVDENTTGYGIGDPMAVLHFVRVMGYHDGYFKDPEARYFHGRFLHELSPFGDLPVYGDGAGYGTSPRLIPQFEHMAAVTRDGRYKWAAHRSLEYLRRFKRDELEYVDSQFYLTDLLWGLHFCDETIAEVAPDWGSELLTRKKYVPGDWDKRFYWYMDENVSMPHAMVLRSGWGVDDLFAAIECSPDGGHAPAMPGAVYYMARDRSLLLTASPYQRRQHQNVVHLNDREGLADKVAEQIRVPLFSDHADATVGRIAITGYQGLPATEERIVLFLKNRFLVVKDRVRFDAPGLYDVSCNWHTQNVGLDTGPNWANTFFATIENWAHIPTVFKTYDRDLLVFCTPQKRHRLVVRNLQDRRLDVFGPIAVGQRWSGRVRTDDALHFTTVLWPHRPQKKTEDLLANFRVKEDSADRTVLEVGYVAKDVYGTRRAYPNLIVHNERGTPMNVTFEKTAVKTDARYLVIQHSERKPTRRLTAVDACAVAIDGKPVHKSAKRVAFEKRW